LVPRKEDSPYYRLNEYQKIRGKSNGKMPQSSVNPAEQILQMMRAEAADCTVTVVK
jgi:hypothetical protein